MLTLTSPIETWAHRLPAGVKLGSLCACTIILFALKSPLALTVAALFALALIASAGRVFLQQSIKMLRPLIPFIVVITLWHLITRDPLGLPIILRMVTAVAIANFVTMTTRLSDMIQIIERLAQPFRAILPPKTLALAIALTLRFIPTMLMRAENIRESWRARAASRPGWRVVLPITLATLDDADHVAQALRARGGLS
jgi:biotin transport system permease protein